ncbi:hypothetical protein NQZ68_012618 [Dissostichus eleginoides]|nr:hypothetical protein NQZ68_012618 [Dissostichus eleginoides]
MDRGPPPRQATSEELGPEKPAQLLGNPNSTTSFLCNHTVSSLLPLSTTHPSPNDGMGVVRVVTSALAAHEEYQEFWESECEAEQADLLLRSLQGQSHCE